MLTRLFTCAPVAYFFNASIKLQLLRTYAALNEWSECDALLILITIFFNKVSHETRFFTAAVFTHILHSRRTTMLFFTSFFGNFMSRALSMIY